ncbi:MAG: hypothetical protein K9M54_00715 [Kiritimatiellales bacterium]|nr:hypothetical protein [Kiritimatiellales bacterium]MCF7864186.1 hypothetical protein [Kiritimatiellales bacterium]
MKMETTIKAVILGAVLVGGTVCFADVLLLQDSFDTTATKDINEGLAGRQTGKEATVGWKENTENDWATQIDDQSLRLYVSGSAGSVFARLDKDFAKGAKHVRIGVDLCNLNATNGFSMVSFGMASADGFDAKRGYGFRLDGRTGSAYLDFYDNGVRKGHMDVSSIVVMNRFSSLQVDFSDGNTISATINGTMYDFGSGQTLYTGTVAPENHVLLGWYGDRTPIPISARFDNLTVTKIP